MKEANDPKPVKSGKKPWVDITDIKTLIELIKNTEVSELEVEKDGVRVKLKKSQGSASSGIRRIQENVSATHQPAQTSASNTAASVPEAAEDKYHLVCSPIVGTFYRSPSPDAESYVNVGDIVKKGQILCIIEAMKLMNEIESEADGKIVEILAEDSHPVEYGAVLFKIEPIS